MCSAILLENLSIIILLLHDYVAIGNREKLQQAKKLPEDVLDTADGTCGSLPSRVLGIRAYRVS